MTTLNKLLKIEFEREELEKSREINFYEPAFRKFDRTLELKMWKIGLAYNKLSLELHDLFCFFKGNNAASPEATLSSRMESGVLHASSHCWDPFQCIDRMALLSHSATESS